MIKDEKIKKEEKRKEKRRIEKVEGVERRNRKIAYQPWTKFSYFLFAIFPFFYCKINMLRELDLMMTTMSTT